ncbi:hypothetical protein LZ31DRAFT_384031 [Colletotrichum somersetense]|nr:hypothetical protein LZ31DRAFT_384031 [Colletotrichum somersetense]
MVVLGFIRTETRLVDTFVNGKLLLTDEKYSLAGVYSVFLRPPQDSFPNGVEHDNSTGTGISVALMGMQLRYQALTACMFQCDRHFA